MGALYRFASIDPVIVQPLALVIVLYHEDLLHMLIRFQISRGPPEERGCAQGFSS